MQNWYVHTFEMRYYFSLAVFKVDNYNNYTA